MKIQEIEEAFKNCEKDIKTILDGNETNEIGTISVTLDIFKIKVENYIDTVLKNCAE